MVERGRAPHECAILPAVSVVIGETKSIAREKAEYLQALIDPELSKASSSSSVGADLTRLKESASLSELQGNQGMKGTEQIIAQTMKADGLTFAQATTKRNAGREIVGTAEMIADRLQETFEAGVCDGFVVAPTYSPGTHEQFCRSVVSSCTGVEYSDEIMLARPCGSTCKTEPDRATTHSQGGGDG